MPRQAPGHPGGKARLLQVQGGNVDAQRHGHAPVLQLLQHRECRLGHPLAKAYLQVTDRKFNRMRPSMARVLGLETRSAKEG